MKRLHRGALAVVRWAPVQAWVGLVVRLREPYPVNDGISIAAPGWCTGLPHPSGLGQLAFSCSQLEPIPDPLLQLVPWADVPGGRPVLSDG